MSNVTPREAGLVLVAINATFPERFPLPTVKEAKGVIVGVWHALLKDLPEGSALAAANSALAEAVHPPAPAEIRERALAGVLTGLTGADAWGRVAKSIGAAGRTRPERARRLWNSSAIEASVAAIGGWVAICNSGNQPADRAQFIRHFEGQMERARSAVLTGAAPSLEAAISDRQKRIAGPSPIAGFLKVGE